MKNSNGIAVGWCGCWPVEHVATIKLQCLFVFVRQQTVKLHFALMDYLFQASQTWAVHSLESKMPCCTSLHVCFCHLSDHKASLLSVCNLSCYFFKCMAKSHLHWCFWALTKQTVGFLAFSLVLMCMRGVSKQILAHSISFETLKQKRTETVIKQALAEVRFWTHQDQIWSLLA